MIGLRDILRQERLQDLRERIACLTEPQAHRFAAWCLLEALSAALPLYAEESPSDARVSRIRHVLECTVAGTSTPSTDDLAAISALTEDMETTLERLMNELLLAEDRFHTRPTQNAGYELSPCDNRTFYARSSAHHTGKFIESSREDRPTGAELDRRAADSPLALRMRLLTHGKKVRSASCALRAFLWYELRWKDNIYRAAVLAAAYVSAARAYRCGYDAPFDGVESVRTRQLAQVQIYAES